MKTKKLLAVIISVVLMLSMFPMTTASAYSKERVTLTFSDSAITPSADSSGYSISGTTLNITAKGTYRITGSCSEGSVIVAGSLSDVTLILDDLTLTSAVTAPIVVKKSSNVLVKLEGSTTLTDNEDASTEETNSDFEGAAIKFKSSSSLTMFGSGTLNINGNAKNGIKGGAQSSLQIDGGTYNVTAANNGIAADGTVTINAGTFNVNAANDGIKSEPDEGDTDSAGKVEINGGTFTVRAQGDGIQAAENLTINDGTFDIKTLNGYNSSSFNKDTMSCKGLKASGNNDNETAPTNQLNITGGTFNLNTADDAVHSDGYVDITGGTFYIYSGDDGVHADATLTLGSSSGYERDPEIYIYSSYEGLEGAVVNAYQGKYYVKASDDGINSAGGSSNGSDAGQGGQDPFRPGGNRPGQQGGQPGGQPGQQGGQSSSGNYSLNIYGGDFYVDCTGDGLDSNGALNLLGGDITVLSMRGGGDNSPIDADGAVTIKGATVFAAGSAGMEGNLTASQGYYKSTNSYNANTMVNVTSGGNVLRSEKLVRNISFLFYTNPTMSSNSASVTTASNVTSCKSNAFAHNYDNGVIETRATTTSTGVMKYTCSDCGDVERKTIPKVLTLNTYSEDSEDVPIVDENDEGYAVTFSTDSHCSVDVYYTQDYTSASETNVTSTVSRNSATGVADSTGEGQVNFTVVTPEGYEVDTVDVDGTYKNLKGPADTGIANTYRVTKVQSALTITVTTKQSSETEETTAVQETTEAQETTTAQNTTTAQETTIAQDTTEAQETTTAQETTVAPTTEAQEGTTAAIQPTTGATTKATQATTSGVGAGTDFSKADSLIRNSKTEEPKGASFGKLQARMTKVTKKSITLKWKKVSGAKKYVIYANKCGTKNKYKKLATVSSSKKTYKVTKAAGKKLKKGTYYKFLIVAVNSNNKVISTACTLHAATKGGKYGNYKGVTTAAKKNKVTLAKAGKTFKLKAKAKAQSKKLKVQQHRAVKYESSNTAVATVSKKGKITAKKKGTCYIYAYSQSGIYKRIKITVK
jgi:hypothetical protein